VRLTLAVSVDPASSQLYGITAQTGIQTTCFQFQLLGKQISEIVTGLGIGGFAVTMTAPPAAAREMGSGDIQLASFDRDPQLIIRAQNEHLLGGRWDGWVSGYGVGGNVEGTGSAAGFDYTLGGTQIGLYRLLDPCTLVGLFGGYGRHYVDVYAATSQTASINTYSLGAFLRQAHCWFGLDGYTIVAGAGAFDQYAHRRDTATGTANGDDDGGQALVYAEHGFERPICCFILTPSAALRYTWLHQGGFTETGAGVSNLTVHHADTHSLRTILGTRILTTARCTRLGEMVPEIRGQWMHEYLDATTGVTATSGGTSFVSPSAGLGRDFAIVGGGLTLRRNACLSLDLNYDLQINERSQFHIAYGGIERKY